MDLLWPGVLRHHTVKAKAVRRVSSRNSTRNLEAGDFVMAAWGFGASMFESLGVIGIGCMILHILLATLIS